MERARNANAHMCAFGLGLMNAEEGGFYLVEMGMNSLIKAKTCT